MFANELAIRRGSRLVMLCIVAPRVQTVRVELTDTLTPSLAARHAGSIVG